MDGLAVTALDLAAEHLAAGTGPEIGVQDVARDLVLDTHAASHCEAALYAKQGVNILVAEAGRPIGDPRADHVVLVGLKILFVGEAHVVSQVIGAPRFLELLQDRKVQNGLGARQTAPQIGNAGFDHMKEGASLPAFAAHTMAKSDRFEALFAVPGEADRLE